MAITVQFYTFAKKANSTKQPTGAALAEFSNVLIKDGSGVVSPVLKIATDSNVSAWNYCVISDFGRSYFIREWRYDNGQWLAYLICDVMGTYKSKIGDSNQYVVRSSVSFPGDIVDEAYPPKATSTRSIMSIEGTIFTAATNTGTNKQYVVGILNSDYDYGTGCVSYYAMSSNQLKQLKECLMSDIDYMGITGSSEKITAKTQINPYQYIVSCRYFPAVISSGTSVNNITVGWWTPIVGTKTLEGDRLTQQLWHYVTQYYEYPKHPLSGTRGVYLNGSPYSKYVLIFANFGEIELDPVGMQKGKYISCEITMDLFSGQGNIMIATKDTNNNIYLVGEANAPCGVDVPLGQLSMEVSTFNPAGEIQMARDAWKYNLPLIGGVLKGAAEAGNAQYTENLIKRDWQDPYSGVRGRTYSDMVGAQYGYNKVTGVTSGSVGTLASVYNHPYPMLVSTFLDMTDDDVYRFGRPLMEYKNMAALGGFIKTSHAELELNATADEQSQVLSTMDGGFYYE